MGGGGPRDVLELTSHFYNLYQEGAAALSHRHARVVAGLSRLDAAARDVGVLRESLRVAQADLAAGELASSRQLVELGRESVLAERGGAEARALKTTVAEKRAAVTVREAEVAAALEKAEPVRILPPFLFFLPFFFGQAHHLPPFSSPFFLPHHQVLREARAAVAGIAKSHLDELRALIAPPAPVRLALEAVLTVLAGDGPAPSTDWPAVKRAIKASDFISSILALQPGA